MGDFDIGTWIGQLRSLEFGILRVDHESFEEGQKATENDLLAVAETEVRDLGVANGLPNARAATEPPRRARFDQRIVEADALRLGGPFLDKSFDFRIVHEDGLEGAQGFEHFPAR